MAVHMPNPKPFHYMFQDFRGFNPVSFYTPASHKFYFNFPFLSLMLVQVMLEVMELANLNPRLDSKGGEHHFACS